MGQKDGNFLSLGALDRCVKENCKTEEKAIAANPHYKEKLREMKRRGYDDTDFLRALSGHKDVMGFWGPAGKKYKYCKIPRNI